MNSSTTSVSCTSNSVQPTVVVNRTVASRFVPIMLLTVLSILMNVGLSGCSQPDTIAPEPVETHESAREMANLLKSDSFEQSKLTSDWYTQLPAANAGKFVNNVARVGKQAMRFSWSPSQYNGQNYSCHAEIGLSVSNKSNKNDNERWFGFSMYLPAANNADDNQVANLMQWYAHPDPGYEGSVPPINMALEPGNTLSFSYRASNVPITKFLQHATSQKIMSLGKAPFDRWVDFVVHIKWDPSGNQGLIQVWQDGQLKIDEQNISVGYVNSTNAWKFGLYCWSGKASHSERVAYFDEVRLGNAGASYNSVRPGVDNKTAR